jgi:hypothetical protein
LHDLMRDEDFAGELATEKAIRSYYTSACRMVGIKPFPWLSVVRHLNQLLRIVYGPAYKKTYARAYEGGRQRKRRIYRIPQLAEFEQAAWARKQEREQRVAKVA